MKTSCNLFSFRMNREAYSFDEIYFDPLDCERLPEVFVSLDSLGSKHLTVSSFSDHLEESVLQLLLASLSTNASGTLETSQTPDITKARLLFHWLSWSAQGYWLLGEMRKVSERIDLFFMADFSSFASSETFLKVLRTKLWCFILLRIVGGAEAREGLHRKVSRGAFL